MSSYASWRVALMAPLLSWFLIDNRFPNDVMIGDSTSARLARSLTIIYESTSAQPQVLRVLFYGQSMTSRIGLISRRSTYAEPTRTLSSSFATWLLAVSVPNSLSEPLNAR
jgi:hypothetical protein